MATSNCKKKALRSFRCCVFGCLSRKGEDSNLTFYSFPKKNNSFVYIVNDFGVEMKTDRRQAWEMILLMKKPACYHHKICSLHFQTSDFKCYVTDSGIEKLVPHNKAVPTLNLPQMHKRVKLVYFCIVRGCLNRSDKDQDKQFFSLPSISQHQGRWYLWMKELGLSKNKYFRVDIKGTSVCSDHFIKGTPSDDKNDPDYVPSIKMGNKQLQIEEVNVLNCGVIEKKNKVVVVPEDPLSFDDHINEHEPEFVSVEMDDGQYMKEEPQDYEELSGSEYYANCFEDIIKVEHPDPQEFMEVKVETPEIFYHTLDHSYCII